MTAPNLVGFTDRARRTIQWAREEAELHGHDWIGTEHLLLGLIREPHGVGGAVLISRGLSLDSRRETVKEVLGPRERQAQVPTLELVTDRAIRVINRAREEASAIGHHYPGTEHLMLALATVQPPLVREVLSRLGLSLQDLRQDVLEVLGHAPGQ